MASASARPSLKSAVSRTSRWSIAELAEPLLTIPPDGGWGWVVCVASFCINFIVDGTMYCFGVFLPEISKDINVKDTEIALASSLLSGFYYILGPLNCAACNRYGFRAIGITGGVLAAGAFFCASYLRSLVPFLLVTGIWGGLAFNLVYTPAAIAVGFYFEKWRALALSLVVCGTALGMVAYPPLITRALGEFSWRIKFKILSGLCVFCSILAIVYKPIKAKKLKVQFGEQEIHSITSEQETRFFNVFQKFKNKFFPTISEISVEVSDSSRPSRVTSRTNLRGILQNKRDTVDNTSLYMGVDIGSVKNALYTLEERSEDDLTHTGCCACCRRKKHPPEKVSKKSCRKSKCLRSKCCKKQKRVFDENYDSVSQGRHTSINRPMYRDDIFYSGSVRSLRSNRTDISTTSRLTTATALAAGGGPALAYTLSVTRASTQRDIDEQGKYKCCPESCVRTLATMLDADMFKSPSFMMLAISGCLSLMGMYIPLIYVAKRATDEYGVEENTAVLLITIIGISNLVGRIVCTLVSLAPNLNVNMFTYVTLLICGSVTVASSFLRGFVLQALFCGVFGFTISTFHSLRSVLFVELFGLENLTNCFGINMLFQSLASFLGVPIANALYNATGNFFFAFSFSGGVIMLSGVLLIPVRKVQHWEENRLR